MQGGIELIVIILTWYSFVVHLFENICVWYLNILTPTSFPVLCLQIPFVICKNSTVLFNTQSHLILIQTHNIYKQKDQAMKFTATLPH